MNAPSLPEPPSANRWDAETARRIEMTCQCHDCDDIPKVEGAGQVFADERGSFQRMHNGVKVSEGCYHGAWMTEIIRRLGGHHEPQEERVFHELLGHVGPGSTMVELGAFWSYYSLWFHRSVAGARNLMVEPDPHNLETGRHNFAINDFQGEFVQASLGREGRQPAPFVCESDGVTRPVAMVSVDGLLREHRIERVELLLADIQGAEAEMLYGAEQSIAEGRIRFMVVSTHHHTISGDPLTHQRCVAFLRDHGAHLLAEHSVAESFSGDGLVVASFDPRDRALQPISLSRNEPARSLFRETEYDLAEAIVQLRHVETKLAAAEAELSQRDQSRLTRWAARLARLWRRS